MRARHHRSRTHGRHCSRSNTRARSRSASGAPRVIHGTSVRVRVTERVGSPVGSEHPVAVLSIRSRPRPCPVRRSRGSDRRHPGGRTLAPTRCAVPGDTVTVRGEAHVCTTPLSSVQRNVDPATTDENANVASDAVVVEAGRAEIAVSGAASVMCTLVTVCSSVFQPVAPVNPSSTFEGRSTAYVGQRGHAADGHVREVVRDLDVDVGAHVSGGRSGAGRSRAAVSPEFAATHFSRSGAAEVGPPLIPTKFAEGFAGFWNVSSAIAVPAIPENPRPPPFTPSEAGVASARIREDERETVGAGPAADPRVEADVEVPGRHGLRQERAPGDALRRRPKASAGSMRDRVRTRTLQCR